MRERIRGYLDAVLEEAGLEKAGREEAGREEAGLEEAGNEEAGSGRPGSGDSEGDSGGGGGLAGLAEDLAGVAGLVASSDDLRFVVADTGVPGHARRRLLSDLLTGRVSGPALRTVLFTIDADRAAEIPDDLAWLATRSAAAAGGLHAVGSGVLGRHGAAERLDGYATAVLGGLGSAGALGNLEDELFRFERIVAGSEPLTGALTSREVPAEARTALVQALLSDKASSAATRLAAYATRVGRPRDYPELLGILIERVAAESTRRVAEVRAVQPLSDAQADRLAEALGRIVGQSVEVRVMVDPEVLGGFVASIGDTVVDGSTRHRLDLLKESLGAGLAPRNADEHMSKESPS